MSLRKDEQGSAELLGISIIVTIFVLLAGIYLIGAPSYKIYKMEQNGKAQLGEAEWTKKIQIKEAKSALGAAKINK